MWHIRERRDMAKKCAKLPLQVVKKYELWKNIVFRHGPDKLREFPGFHHEKLRGELGGRRSSRLSAQYRVVNRVEKDAMTVFVLGITPHEY